MFHFKTGKDRVEKVKEFCYLGCTITVDDRRLA